MCCWSTREGVPFANRHLHERNWKGAGRFGYHDRLLQFIPVFVKSDARPDFLDDSVAATWEAFGDKGSESAPSVVAVSISTNAGDDKAD